MKMQTLQNKESVNLTILKLVSYRGDIGVILENRGSEQFIVHSGDRIAQAVLCPVQKIMWNQLNSLEDLESSERGEGGFGHSGIN